MSNAAFPILDAIDRLKADIDALRPLDPEVEQRVMDKFRLDWNYNSNAIEGNSLSLGETRAFLLEGITAHGKPFKDYLDIKGHDAAIEYLLDYLRSDEQLTEVDIRRLHEILLVEPYEIDAKTPEGRIVKRTVEIGRYKRYPNHVETSTGKIKYYATPEETPAKMQDLMAWFREEETSGDLHPVIVAALFHHRFVAIHPFDDGNGRMTRLLTNLNLMKHGYPPIIIQKEDRGAYFLALAEADEGHADDIINLIGARLASSMELYLRGARGEDISSLGDFDKRLSLLKQRLETSSATRPEKTIEGQVRLFKQVIEPLLVKLSPSLAKVDALFVTHSSHVTGGSFLPILVDNNNPNFLGLFQRLNVDNVSIIVKTDEWQRMKAGRPDSTLISSISFKLDPTNFTLSYSINNEVSKLFNGPYNSTFSEDEIEQFAIEILDNLYKKIESLSS